MRGNGFLLFALVIAAIFYGAYFSLGPLERWQKRLVRDLERLKGGAGKCADATEPVREPEQH